MLRWEGYTTSDAAAARWHVFDRNAAQADSFGVTFDGNAVLRPQMTPLQVAPSAGTQRGADLQTQHGCVIVTGKVSLRFCVWGLSVHIELLSTCFWLQLLFGPP